MAVKKNTLLIVAGSLLILLLIGVTYNSLSVACVVGLGDGKRLWQSQSLSFYDTWGKLLHFR